MVCIIIYSKSVHNDLAIASVTRALMVPYLNAWSNAQWVYHLFINLSINCIWCQKNLNSCKTCLLMVAASNVVGPLVWKVVLYSVDINSVTLLKLTSPQSTRPRPPSLHNNNYYTMLYHHIHYVNMIMSQGRYLLGIESRKWAKLPYLIYCRWQQN